MLDAHLELQPRAASGEARFYTIIIAAMVLLAAATLAVILYGSHPRLRVGIELSGSSAAASSRPRIVLRFARPVAPGSVESRLRLVPEVPFTVAWRDREAQIILSEALQPETGYTLSLAEGVTTRDGQPLEGAAEWRFTTRPLRLAFLSLPPDENGVPVLQMAALDGSAPQLLSAPGQHVRDYGVAPDGSQVIYSVDEAPDTVNFWRAQPHNRGWDRVTDEQGVIYSAPRWSPTGDILAHEERRVLLLGEQKAMSNPKVALMRPDGSPAGMVYGQGDEVGHSPAWSPDATRLAFYDGIAQMVTIFNFTDELRRFPANSGGVGSWSPDGRAMVTTAIVEDGQGVRQLLSVRDLDMGTEQFIDEPAGQLGDPAWGPDGGWIAYAYLPPMGLPRGSEIVLTRPDGSDRRVLVSRADASLSNPIWSPTGDWIAFTLLSLTDPAALPELWVVRTDGSDLRQVAVGAYLAQWIP